MKAEAQAIKAFKTRLDAIDPGDLRLTPSSTSNDQANAWTASCSATTSFAAGRRIPTLYSSGITNTAYMMIKRNFAPPEQRLKSLIAREKPMPAALAEARKNLDNPPRIYVEIAIEQLDGNRDFFKSAVPAAFNDVKDAALLAEFKKANDAVIAALDDYKTWLQKDLLPRANGDVRLRRRHLPEEARGRRDDRHAARRLAVDRRDRPEAEPGGVRRGCAKDRSDEDRRWRCWRDVRSDHPPADEAAGDRRRARSTRSAQFITDHHIVDHSAGGARHACRRRRRSCARRRSASMDTPGPFEKVATEAYYNMTLPDPTWPHAEPGRIHAAVVLRR